MHRVRPPRPYGAAPVRGRCVVQTSAFMRGQKALRDDNGHILGMRPRTGEELLTYVLANAKRQRKTGCLLSTLTLDEKGYPRCGKSTRAHRVVFFKGIPPKGGAQVLHTCDVRHCVESAHLYAGDNRRNIADKVARDRSGKKLNIAKVRRIKAMLTQGIRLSRIAYRFGVDDRTIYHIKAGTHWAHVQNSGGTSAKALVK